MLIAAFDYAWYVGAVAVTGIVLAAVYMLWAYQRMMTGPDPGDRARSDADAAGVDSVGDLGRREIGVLAPLMLGAGAVRLLPDAAARRQQPDRRRAARAHGRPRRRTRTCPAEAEQKAEEGAALMFDKPTIEYAELWPMLVVFGVACLGVIVEAFVPRERRYLTQGGLAVARPARRPRRRGLRRHGARRRSATPATTSSRAGPSPLEGTIAVDGPTIFIWGLVLVFAIGGVLLFAERRLEGGVSAFAGQAAALPGTEAEREASTRGLDHTEVYPLMMFAVGGMMLFPAANDLLTMFLVGDFDVLALRDLIALDDVLAVHLVACFSVHLHITDAIAGVLVELVEPDLLALAGGGVERDWTRNERQAEVTFPVRAGGHDHTPHPGQVGLNGPGESRLNAHVSADVPCSSCVLAIRQPLGAATS